MSFFRVLSCALLLFAFRSSARADATEFGLGPDELVDYEHLSVGADFLPYEWLIHMKSAPYRPPDGKPASVLADLDRRFNFLVSQDASRYLLPYTGLTASWT